MDLRRFAAAGALAAGLVGAATLPASAAHPAHVKANPALAYLRSLHLQSRPAGSSAATQATSPNWAGWADVQPSSGSNVYKSVSASWAEPSVKCTSEDRAAIFWVGLDGYSSSTVEQAGTLAQCFQGKAAYYTWWELYPTNNITVVGTTVKPGDAITATVSFDGTNYHFTVTDSTTSGNDVSTTAACSSGCTNSSAEVIAERPSSSYGLYPLAQFSTWKPSKIAVADATQSGTITTFPDSEITMYDITGTYPLAVPSAFKASTKSFTVTWKNSY